MNTKFTSFLLLIWLFAKVGIAQNGIKELTPFPSISFLDKRSISDIETDVQGRIWASFGTFKPGATILFPSRVLMVLSNNAWQVIKPDSLGGPAVKYISDLAIINGSIYAASPQGLLDFGNGNQCVVIKYAGPGASPALDSINHINFHNGLIYLSTQGGLLEYNPISSSNPWKIYSQTSHNLPTNSILGSTIDKQNNIWLATKAGVVKLVTTTSTLSLFNRANGNFHTDTILSIAITSNGDIWAGTQIRPYQNEKESTYGYQNDGLPGLYLLTNNRFNNIALLQNACTSAVLPAFNFPKISITNNKVVFIGAIKKWNAPSNLFFAAYYEVSGETIKETQIKPFSSNPGNYAFGSTQQNKSNWLLPVATPLQVEPDKLTHDSSYDYLVSPYANYKYEMQDINNLKAPISTHGDMFWDGDQKT